MENMNNTESKVFSAAIDLQTYHREGNDEEGALRLLLALRDILRARKYTRVVCFGLSRTLPQQVTDLLQYMALVAGMEVILQHPRPENSSSAYTTWFSYAEAQPGATAH